MSDEEHAARELVSLLLSSSSDSASEGSPEGARSALRRLTLELDRWVGATACSALQQRALASARQRHPVLAAFRVDDSAGGLVGTVATLESKADDSLFEALEEVMVQLLFLLTRLIGIELSTRIVNQAVVATQAAGTASDPEEGTAE